MSESDAKDTDELPAPSDEPDADASLDLRPPPLPNMELSSRPPTVPPEKSKPPWSDPLADYDPQTRIEEAYQDAPPWAFDLLDRHQTHAKALQALREALEGAIQPDSPFVQNIFEGFRRFSQNLFDQFHREHMEHDRELELHGGEIRALKRFHEDQLDMNKAQVAVNTAFERRLAALEAEMKRRNGEAG